MLINFQRAFCAYCRDRIWGLGRQGFKCTQCKLLIHKKCHKLIQKPCSNESVEPIQRDETNGEPSTTSKCIISFKRIFLVNECYYLFLPTTIVL